MIDPLVVLGRVDPKPQGRKGGLDSRTSSGDLAKGPPEPVEDRPPLPVALVEDLRRLGKSSGKACPI